MSCEIKDLGGLKRNMKLTIDEASYQKQYQQQLELYAKQSPQQKGFRKGKVKPQAMAQMLGKNEREKISREIISRQFFDYCNQEKISPATVPQDFELPTILAGVPVSCSIDFEVMPEITLKDVKNIKLERLQAAVDDEAVKLALTNLQQQFAEWKEKESGSTAEKGDQAVIDFVGSTDAGEFPGGKGEGFEIELGAGQMIAGFEDGIYGMKVTETKEIDVTFPDPYHSAELAGKPAKFSITLRKINSKQLPEINDDLALKAGITEGGIETLKKEMTKHLKKQLDQNIFNKLKDSALKKLREQNPAELPESLVDADIQHAQQMTMQRIAQQTGHKAPTDMPMDRNLFLEGSKERVHTGLLISKIITDNEIRVDEKALQTRISDIAASYDDPQKVIEHYMQNREAMEQLQHSILEDQAVQWVIDNADVTDKPVSFTEATTAETENVEKS